VECFSLYALASSAVLCARLVSALEARVQYQVEYNMCLWRTRSSIGF